MRSVQRPWLSILAGGVFALAPAPLLGQVPAGGEFRLNTYTTGHQGDPAVAWEPDGDFVAVWSSSLQPGTDSIVVGQRYAAGANPRGAEFQVATGTTSYQFSASVAADARGRLVVVWHGRVSSTEVYARRFGADGVPIGAEFVVNAYTTNDQGFPSVAGTRHGDFVVVWEGHQTSASPDVFGQRFDREGRRVGGEFQVNSVTSGFQFTPAVAVHPSNAFVVAWKQSEFGGGENIFARLFGSDGQPRGPEFRVSTSTTVSAGAPSVATADSGAFVVVWQNGPWNGPFIILARRFDPAGTAIGGEFQVNSPGNGNRPFRERRRCGTLPRRVGHIPAIRVRDHGAPV